MKNILTTLLVLACPVAPASGATRIPFGLPLSGAMSASGPWPVRAEADALQAKIHGCISQTPCALAVTSISGLQDHSGFGISSERTP